MEKNTKKGGSAQGAEKPKTLTEDEFKKMVHNDLRTCYSFLAAIANDGPTMAALNEYLYGRYLNQIHKAELENQLEFNRAEADLSNPS